MISLFAAITIVATINPLALLQPKSFSLPIAKPPNIIKVDGGDHRVVETPDKPATNIPLALRGNISLQNEGGLSVSNDLFLKTVKAHNDEIEAQKKAKLEAANKARLEALEAQRVVDTYVPPAPVKPSVKVSSDNTYTPLNCTWYVKSRRPDIPNTWHNAYQWLDIAQAQGWPTGHIPRVGAIAWFKAYSHVAYVEAIGDGTVTVAEMNYKGLGVIDSRVVPINQLEFIY